MASKKEAVAWERACKSATWHRTAVGHQELKQPLIASKRQGPITPYDDKNLNSANNHRGLEGSPKLQKGT